MIAKPQLFVLFKGEVEQLVPFVELSSLEDSNLSSLYNTLSHGGLLEYFDKLYTSCLGILTSGGGDPCTMLCAFVGLQIILWQLITIALHFYPVYYKIPADH